MNKLLVVVPYKFWFLQYQHWGGSRIYQRGVLCLTVCARSERRGLFIPVSSPVATFEQSENVAIAHLVRAACFAKGRGLCNRVHLRMRTVLMGNLAQAGYCLCMNYVSMFCEHVLLIDDHAC